MSNGAEYKCPHCLGPAMKRGDQIVCEGMKDCVFTGTEDDFEVVQPPKDQPLARATPVQMRKCLELVHQFKMAGILFVPIPVIGDTDELYAELTRKLDIIEKNCQD